MTTRVTAEDKARMRKTLEVLWRNAQTAAEDVLDENDFFYDPRPEPSRPNAACFDFAAIRHHRDVMHGDTPNGTVYSHDKHWAYTERTGYRQRTREHNFDIMTQRCTACLWSAQHVRDGMAHSHCEGHPPKGERCMNCGKPHVVSIQHRGNWMTQCLSCFQGVMTHGPIRDRGAVRFEQRNIEGLVAIPGRRMGKGLTAVQEYIEKQGRTAIAKLEERYVDLSKRHVELPPGSAVRCTCDACKEPHPDGCVCNDCIPF